MLLIPPPRAAGRGRLSRRRGAVIVMYCLALTLMAAMLALVVDVGYLYAVKAREQTAADMAALTALGSAGSSYSGQNKNYQIAQINLMLDWHKTANGISSPGWATITGLTPDGTDVAMLVLNRPVVTSTYFLNVFSKPTVTVGVQAVAVRSFISYTTSQQTTTPGMNLFGCKAIDMAGNPEIYSRNFETGVVAQKANSGSNGEITLQGNVEYGGFVGSSGSIEFIGGAAEFNGTYQAPDIDGAPGDGTFQAVEAPYPPVTMTAAVADATRLDNDNELVESCNTLFRTGVSTNMTDDFKEEKHKGKDKERIVKFPAGARIYATSVDLTGARLIITGDPRPPPTGSGPVTITLDAEGTARDPIWLSNKDFEIDDDPDGMGMKPSYIRMIGINPPATCDKNATTWPVIEFNKHIAYALIYAPGFKFDLASNPTFHGNIVCDYIYAQAGVELICDELNGFPYISTPALVGTPGRVRLIN